MSLDSKTDGAQSKRAKGEAAEKATSHKGPYPQDFASTQERLVPMRLQKFLARAGAASRRGAEDLMTAGRVTVNGQVVKELGSKVDPAVDEVAVDGIPVHLTDRPVTIMLHKPMDYVTTMSDPHARHTVAELVPTDRYPGLFPIGRLDRDTTGLLLFSTDGELGNRLLHPSRHVDKVYDALVKGKPTDDEIELLRGGVVLDDGMTAPAQVTREARHRGDPRGAYRLAISIHEGRKRQVKRMCEAIGHEVIALHRRSFGPLELGALEVGYWRELTAEELAALGACVDLPC